MSEWLFTVSIQARDRRDAEDFAAPLVDEIERQRRGRTSLSYRDPITGEFTLWAEPALGTADLELHRSPL
jgi:hypothetical protein